MSRIYLSNENQRKLSNFVKYIFLLIRKNKSLRNISEIIH